MTDTAKSSCVYCGAAPAPHVLLYINSAISIFFGRMMRVLALPLLALLSSVVIRLTNVVTHLLLSLFKACGGAVFSSEYVPSHLDRKSVIFTEAKARGIRIETLRLFDKDMAEARAWLPLRPGAKNYRWWYFEHIPIPPWKEAPATQDIDNKEEFKKIFRKRGLKVPLGKPVVTLSGAKAVLKRVNGPVIVKPLDGSRARHTSVNVRTTEELATAVRIARMICPMLMVEECIEGTVHRVTCIDGKVAGIIKFVRPTMIADGIQTTDELREKWNENLTFADVTPIADNAVFHTTLAHQGYATGSIPPRGAVVTLAEFSERANGGYNEDMTDRVPAKTIAYFEKAAKTSGLAVVGFDVITKDITDPQEPVTFLEANTAPFIEIHHTPSIGTPRNVAGKVWDLWLS